METTYNIFLDDNRQPIDAYKYTNRIEYKNFHWNIVDSYDAFVDLFTKKIMENELPRIVSFDHDLATEHYLVAAKNLLNSFDESSVKIPTGWHALLWMLNTYAANDIKLPHIMFHTKNPAGLKNMQALIDQYENNRQNKWMI